MDVGDQGEWLVDRAIYTISSISDDGLYLRLVEIPFEGIFGRPAGFFSHRFRPIVKTDISVFQKMLAPAPRQTVSV